MLMEEKIISVDKSTYGNIYNTDYSNIYSLNITIKYNKTTPKYHIMTQEKCIKMKKGQSKVIG